jgi:hypothetical protein
MSNVEGVEGELPDTEGVNHKQLVVAVLKELLAAVEDDRMAKGTFTINPDHVVVGGRHGPARYVHCEIKLDLERSPVPNTRYLQVVALERVFPQEKP